jgi:hypothetical protein
LTTCAGERPLSGNEALDRIAKERGEVFDPWLVDVFTEEVQKAPPTCAPDREVMIVPAGAMPWRAPEAAEEEEDEEVGGDGELEVMLDDPLREDAP